jgi:hypothetical protein
MKIQKTTLLLVVVIMSLFLSCRIYKREPFNYLGSEKTKELDFFVKLFKDRVFFKCLNYGYGNDLYFNVTTLMASKDLFNSSDSENFLDKKLIDSLAKRLILNLPPPSVHVEDLKTISDKNFIVSTALSYYESKELDSIAKSEYKKKIKENKKLGF